jgi:4'-phosphopantetheinyl transferase
LSVPRGPDAEDIAGRFFCAEEAEELAEVPSGERDVTFFNCWTRKEAHIKAIGNGLSEPLDSFRVTLHPGDSARMVHISRDTNAAAEWTLHDLPVTDGNNAALEYRDRRRKIRLHPAIDSSVFTAAI